jgi:hypothetical protein
VRATPGVADGDEVAITIESGRVILSKAPPCPSRVASLAEDPFGIFGEWASDADREAFADL